MPSNKDPSSPGQMENSQTVLAAEQRPDEDCWVTVEQGKNEAARTHLYQTANSQAQSSKSVIKHNAVADQQHSPQHPPAYLAKSTTIANEAPSEGLGVLIPHFNQSSEPLVHTASSEGSVDLRHPAPGLEALQGAYVANVERLEESAERLSMTSSSIGEELRRIREEQKRSESRSSSQTREYITEDDLPLPPPPHRQFSESSAANSIISTNHFARNGGYSPGGAIITSPQGSILSRSNSQSRWGRTVSQSSRLARKPLPDQELRRRDTSSQRSQQSITSPPSHPMSPPERGRPADTLPHHYQPEALHHLEGALHNQSTSSGQVDRPVTPASTNSQHIRDMFTDFDGIHYSPGKEPTFTAPRSRQSREMSTAGHSKRQSRDLSAVLQSNRQSREMPVVGDLQLHDQSSNVPAPSDRQTRETPVARPTPTERPQSYADRAPGMVYYPAPVPMMLNLPQRLSKFPNASRERRRTKVVDSIATEAKRTASWLPEICADGELIEQPEPDRDLAAPPRQSLAPRRSMNALAGLPPQLRASAFFDQPAARQEVKVKEDSAVATLDSILDASAHAPVGAFTDHPIVGKAGAAGIYKRERPRQSTAILAERNTDTVRRRSSFNMLLGEKAKRGTTHNLQDIKQRMSSRLSLGKPLDAPGDHSEGHDEIDEAEGEGEHARLQPDEGDGLEPDADEDGLYYSPDEESLEDDDEHAAGAPTTLLAELQLRKHQLKQRNRTAATAFPNGMHSTLLELDAVAAVQKESRRHKHVALAWEDHTAGGQGHPQDEDDDEVPLAVLFPGGKQKQRLDGNIPLGLMEKREIEDNEPLSQRRNRLRGGYPIARPASPGAAPAQPKSPFQLEVPGLTDNAQSGSDDEGETLAQRIHRLKAQQHASSKPKNSGRSISGDFASEWMSQFGGDVEEKAKEPASPPVDPDDETLGQRRKRLQAERDARGGGDADRTIRPPMKPRHSMADLLQLHPAAGARPGHHAPGYQPQLQHGYYSTAGFPMQQHQQSYGMPMSAQPYGTNYPMNSYAPDPYAGMGMSMAKPMPMQIQTTAMAVPQMGMPYGQLPQLEQDIDPQRRDLIDRWRQSVMP